MKKITLLIIFAILLPVLFVSAQKTEKEKKKLYKSIYKETDQITTYIQQAINTLTEENKLTIEGEKVLSKKFLPKFYMERNYEPAWSDFDSFIDAIEVLESSYEDGLLPVDYHFEGLVRIRDTILHEKNVNKLDYKWVAKFDILLTDAVFLYAFHLIDGKTDPHSLDVDWNFGYVDLPEGAPENLTKAIEKKTISEQQDKLRPDFPEYRIMMKELALYRKIKDDGGWETIEVGGKIDPGDSVSRIPLIKKRLAITGDLADLNNLEDEVYNEELEKDIKSFQDRHGLEADGIIGKGTFAALNIPVEKKIDMLRVNMERARWIMHNVGTDYIVVNIARYKVFIEHNYDLVYHTNVIVGKTYHKTPVFKAKLEYIEFNPTWTVPVSITRNEMIPKMKKDHGYLKKNHLVLLDGSGKVVPESVLDYSTLSAHNFPYTIRQIPGPWNALGIVKFIFPNKHSVFLHDTESRGLFKNTNRTYSHGCIRVENPLDMAEVLLRDTEWDREKIDELVNSKQTKRVFPKTKFDVYLLYWTTGVMGTDKIFFLPDVYERDQAVLRKLDQKVSSVRSADF